MYAAFVPIDKTTGSLIRCSLQFQGLWHDLRHLVRYLVVIHMATMIEMYGWFKQSNKNISISKLDYHWNDFIFINSRKKRMLNKVNKKNDMAIFLWHKNILFNDS